MNMRSVASLDVTPPDLPHWRSVPGRFGQNACRARPERGVLVGAKDPHQIDALYVAAYRDRDADSVADLYEDDAVYAMAMAGLVLNGRDAIRENVRAMFAAMTEIALAYDDHEVILAGEYAFTHGTSRTRFTIDGQAHDTVTRSTVILHQGEDGNWRILIDHAS
jgi:uncharacterized protein (TIGR02246 family)